MHHPTDKITHTTASVTPVVEHWLEREIAQWVHPMKDRSGDPSHHERLYKYVCRRILFESLSEFVFEWCVFDFVYLLLFFLFFRERDVAPW